jgi:hypothetical protein
MYIFLGLLGLEDEGAAILRNVGSYNPSDSVIIQKT